MIKRNLLPKLIDHLQSPEITIITGPRQCGKTTLMRTLLETIESQGKQAIYLNYDIEKDKDTLESQQKFLQYLQAQIGNNGYVFIDEIQGKENAGLFLKGLYDMNLNYKFIVSGSGSIELKEKVQESLAGRKRLFKLTTLTFEEFVNHKTNYKYESNLESFFKIETEKGELLLEEYLTYGGYPKVVLSETLEEKTASISDIYESYLIKDISHLLGVNKIPEFRDLVTLLASGIGNLTNYNTLSNSTSLKYETLIKYLYYLEKTFILTEIKPYFTNKSKEVIKAPILYFTDLGLRNYAVDQFGQLNSPIEKSFVFENFVLNILKEKIKLSNKRINFWRTQSGAEVDLIVRSGSKVVPFEIKYQKMSTFALTRSYYNFVEKYKPENGYVVNLELDRKEQINSTTVAVLPYYELLNLEL